MLTDQLDYDGKTWVEMNNYCLEFLPPAVRENLKTNKSIRRGYANLFGHIAECLRQKRAPSAENVLSVYQSLSEWPLHTRNYLGRGGHRGSCLPPMR
jgi:hypothetical protein